MSTATVPAEVEALARFEAEQRATRAAAAVAPVPVEKWPDPLAPDALDGLAGEFVRLVAPHTEADPVALLGQFLAGVGCLIGHGPRFMVGADAHTPRLFVVLVGNTARGRKGTSWGWVRHVLAEVGDKFSERIVSGLSSGEGLIYQVRDPRYEWQKPKGKARGEAQYVMTDPGVDDKRLLVVEHEFARALRAGERTGSTLSPVLRLAWDGADLRILTKTAGDVATGAHVALAGHITIDELRRCLTETDAANGYGNRHLWLAVRRARLLPDGGSLRPDDLRPLVAELRGRVEAARRLGELRRTPAAAEQWREVYPSLTREETGMFGSMVARAEAQVLRLSLLYALLDASPAIEPEHINAALAVWRYAEDSARLIFGHGVGDAVADEIARALTAAPDGLTRTDIHELLGRHVSAGRLSVALGTLARLGRATATTEQTDGRPAQRWRWCERSEKSEERGCA